MFFSFQWPKFRALWKVPKIQWALGFPLCMCVINYVSAFMNHIFFSRSGGLSAALVLQDEMHFVGGAASVRAKHDDVAWQRQRSDVFPKWSMKQLKWWWIHGEHMVNCSSTNRCDVFLILTCDKKGSAVLDLQKNRCEHIGAKERVSEWKSSAFWPKLRGCSKKMSIDVVPGFLWVSMHLTTENEGIPLKKRWPIRSSRLMGFQWLGPFFENYYINIYILLHITTYHITTYYDILLPNRFSVGRNSTRIGKTAHLRCWRAWCRNLHTLDHSGFGSIFWRWKMPKKGWWQP